MYASYLKTQKFSKYEGLITTMKINALGTFGATHIFKKILKISGKLTGILDIPPTEALKPASRLYISQRQGHWA